MILQRKDLQLRHGGLYRCCVESASQWVQDKPDEPVREGEVVDCVYERKPRMIVKGNVLQWNEPMH